MLLSSPPSLSWGWLNQSLLEIFKFLLSLVFTLIRLVNKQNPIIAQIKNLQIETSIKLCGQWTHWELPSLFPIPHNNIPNRPTKPDPLFWKAQLINHSSRPKLFFFWGQFSIFYCSHYPYFKTSTDKTELSTHKHTSHSFLVAMAIPILNVSFKIPLSLSHNSCATLSSYPAPQVHYTTHPL